MSCSGYVNLRSECDVRTGGLKEQNQSKRKWKTRVIACYLGAPFSLDDDDFVLNRSGGSSILCCGGGAGNSSTPSDLTPESEKSSGGEAVAATADDERSATGGGSNFPYFVAKTALASAEYDDIGGEG